MGDRGLAIGRVRDEPCRGVSAGTFANAETVKPAEAVGRVSAEPITPYPPGIPAVAPGDVFNNANVAYLEEIVANGAFVEGASDPSLRHLRVVA
jgi:arginine/lysine/ornithine decarboxylase